MQTFDQQSRAPADRLQPRRIGRLVINESRGRATFAAELLDVSVLGCELRVYTPLDAGRAARFGIKVGDTTLWFPVLTRTVHRTSHGWTITCVFDRPSELDQRSIYALMAARNGG